MITRRVVTDEIARRLMASGELEEELRDSAPLVALVLTQGWCPQWASMKGWLDRYERLGKPADQDIVVYEYIYDRSPFFAEFRRFKEEKLKNDLVPYVRYYRNGSLVGQSNFVPARRFLAAFHQQAR